MLKKKILGGLLGFTGLLLLYFQFACPSFANQPLHIERALAYLKLHQMPDGGFAEEGASRSDPRTTSWVLMALSYINLKTKDEYQNSLSYLADSLVVKENLRTDTNIARTILTLQALGENPRNFAGKNWVSELQKFLKPTGQIGESNVSTAFGVMALRAAGEETEPAVNYLISQQKFSGGWAYTADFAEDSNTTAQVLLALEGRASLSVIEKGLNFLKSLGTLDGGIKYMTNAEEGDAFSDAYALMAFLSAEEKFQFSFAEADLIRNHLLSLQQSDGSFNHTKTQRLCPVVTTATSLLGLVGKSLALVTPTLSNTFNQVTLTLTKETETPTIATTYPTPSFSLTETFEPTFSLTLTPETKINVKVEPPRIIEPFTLPKPTKTFPAFQEVVDKMISAVSDFLKRWERPVLAEEKNRAGLVVQHFDGRLIKKCVLFSEKEITGLDLLKRAGLSVNEKNGFVYLIDGERAPGSLEKYWSYWHLENGVWRYSNKGAGAYMVKNGNVDGWRLGDGKKAPALIKFEEICDSTAQMANLSVSPTPTLSSRNVTFWPSPSYTLTPKNEKRIPAKTLTVVPPRIYTESAKGKFILLGPIMVGGSLAVGLFLGWLWFFKIKRF